MARVSTPETGIMRTKEGVGLALFTVGVIVGGVLSIVIALTALWEHSFPVRPFWLNFIHMPFVVLLFLGLLPWERW